MLRTTPPKQGSPIARDVIFPKENTSKAKTSQSQRLTPLQDGHFSEKDNPMSSHLSKIEI